MFVPALFVMVKRALTYLAAVTALGALAAWLALGAHRGWTMTSVPRKAVDEVTGIEFLTYERGFVPGVDFLGAGLVMAGLLALVAWFLRSQPTKNSNA